MKNWRLNLVLLGIFLAFATLTGRLINIQITDHQYWKALSQGQQQISGNLSENRGEIFLTGTDFPAATNHDSPFIYVSPPEIKDKEKTVSSLKQILGLEEDFIYSKIEKEESLFSMLKEKISDEEINNIKAADLSGVYLGKERIRYYNFGSLASDVLGFLGGDGNGQYGVEGYYNEDLQNEGADIFLTIDYNIQFMAEKLLQGAKDSLDIEGGQIIVMDPNDGKILAMADFPNFDPNNYSFYIKEGGLEIFQNSITQKMFEPGSTFKPITMAAGLEEGKITPQTTYIDEGFVKIGGSMIKNYDGRKYGQRTMTEVLEKSINTGAVFVEQSLAHSVFLDYVDKFGFFEDTGIDLPEVSSENKELKKGYEINYATCSFGQGIEMTPIQLARAFCVIANGGKLVKPYIIDRMEYGNGKIYQTQPEISDPIISQKTVSQLSAMLVSVIENGYSKSAKISGYYMGGKTGTAQVSFSALGIQKSGYSDKTVQTFVGFAPAFDPKFLILVKLDNPKTGTAEYSAVPIFHDLAKYIIDYQQISPDYINE